MHYILTILGYINVDLLWKALGSLRLVRVRFYWIISGVPQMALLFWFGLVSKLKPRKVECYPEERQSLLPPAGARPLSAVSQEPGVSSACFPSICVSILCLLTGFPEDTVGDFDTRTLPKFGSPGRGTESHVLSLQEVSPLWVWKLGQEHPCSSCTSSHRLPDKACLIRCAKRRQVTVDVKASQSQKQKKAKGSYGLTVWAKRIWNGP